MVVCLVHLLEALGPERWSVRRPSQRVDQDIISMQVIDDLGKKKVDKEIYKKTISRSGPQGQWSR